MLGSPQEEVTSSTRPVDWPKVLAIYFAFRLDHRPDEPRILLQELTRARLQRDLLSDAVAISACGLGHAWPRAEGLVAELRSRSTEAVGR